MGTHDTASVQATAEHGTSETDNENATETGSGEECVQADARPELSAFRVASGMNLDRPIDELRVLETGSPIELVRGNQGLMMFTIIVLDDGFVLPCDPQDFTSPDAPLLDLRIGIEGFSDAEGVYARAGGRLRFWPPMSGPGQSVYMPVIAQHLPGEASVLDGKLATIRGTLATREHGLFSGEALQLDTEFVVHVLENRR